MATNAASKAIDTYIANAAPFAIPILSGFRDLVHATCPECEETVKWGMPTFMYHSKILCGMSAFKAHASVGFWQHDAVLGEGASQPGMGSFGKLTSVKDLPPKRTLQQYIKKAMALIDDGTRTVRKTAVRKTNEMPPELAAALKKNKSAGTHFKAFPPGAQREYIDWIIEAKREETRERRLLQAIEWIAEGKRRNWKYENC